MIADTLPRRITHVDERLVHHIVRQAIKREDSNRRGVKRQSAD